MTKVKELSAWKSNMRQGLSELSIETVEVRTDDNEKMCQLNAKDPHLAVGSELKVVASVRLGKLKPDDVSVEIYYGQVDSAGRINHGEVAPMEYQSNGQVDGIYKFGGAVPCMTSGQHGFALRILPRHVDLVDPYEAGMIIWESEKAV